MALTDLDSDDSDSAHSNAQALPVPLSNPDASHRLTSGEYDCLEGLQGFQGYLWAPVRLGTIDST